MGDRGEGALNFHKGKVRSNFSLVSQVCCQKELGLEKYTAVHGHARRPRPRPRGFAQNRALVRLLLVLRLLLLLRVLLLLLH